VAILRSCLERIPLILKRTDRSGDEEHWQIVQTHNDAGEVDAEAFATFVSVLNSGDPSVQIGGSTFRFLDFRPYQ
jgi:hypothetical protein